MSFVDDWAAKAMELNQKVSILEAERDYWRGDALEQARLLGMGGEREAKLHSERDMLRERLAGTTAAWEKEVKNLDVAWAEIGALRAALKEYGEHHEECHVNHGYGLRNCTCGLEKIVSGASDKEVTK